MHRRKAAEFGWQSTMLPIISPSHFVGRAENNRSVSCRSIGQSRRRLPCRRCDRPTHVPLGDQAVSSVIDGATLLSSTCPFGPPLRTGKAPIAYHAHDSRSRFMVGLHGIPAPPTFHPLGADHRLLPIATTTSVRDMANRKEQVALQRLDAVWTMLRIRNGRKITSRVRRGGRLLAGNT